MQNVTEASAYTNLISAQYSVPDVTEEEAITSQLIGLAVAMATESTAVLTFSYR